MDLNLLTNQNEDEKDVEEDANNDGNDNDDDDEDDVEEINEDEDESISHDKDGNRRTGRIKDTTVINKFAMTFRDVEDSIRLFNGDEKYPVVR